MSEESQETPENIFAESGQANQESEEQGQQPTETPSNESTSSPDSIFADQLGSIKNENGVQKYNTVSDALKGAAHAQEYIQQLKQQLDEANGQLKEKESELEQYKGINDVLNSQNNEEATTSESLDEASIEELLDKKLTERQKQERAVANRNSVNQALVDQFGDVKSAKEAFEAKAQELEMSPQELASLAERSPKAVTSYFQTQQNRSVDVEGSKRPDAMKQEEDVDYNVFSTARSKEQKLRAWRASKPQV